MSDEQRVRTMAGWIGVEISRSRLRTPGKAGYGLWRVRGSVGHRTRDELDGLTPGAVTPDGMAERGPWTEYLFKLESIELGVRVAIQSGTHGGPGKLTLPVEPSGGRDTRWVTVPARWTSAYRGPRNLGETGESLVLDLVLPSTVRSRQRAANAEFQAEHLERRKHGLVARQAAKLSRQERSADSR